MQRKHICGGTVVGTLWVLTAAHCVHELKVAALVVVAGDHNLYIREGSVSKTLTRAGCKCCFPGLEQPRYIQEIFVNNFDLNTFANDIALLKVTKPFVLYKGSVAPICLPDKKEYFEGKLT